MAFTRMRYHIIFATKGRKRWIDEEIESFLYQIICRQFRLNDGAVVTLGGVEDHVHVVAGIHPTVAVTDVVQAVKRDSSKAVRRNFKHRRSFKWQVSFGGFTACPNDMKELIDYVDNQKEHHKNETLIQKYELLLDKCTEDENSGADGADGAGGEDGADGAEKEGS
jgi:REP element-mobilizing transposase RayT